MCFASALGFGLAAMMATGDVVLGFNVGFGVFFFLVSLQIGIRTALRQVEDGEDV